MRRRRSLGGGFSPRKLFADGTVGAWYDPSDYSTLFQDSAGTTPVTAVEQPVGLMLDKSGNNNHASQSTSTSRPVLRARYNLLTYSEQFDNAAWSKISATVSANASVAPDGTTTADRITASAASSGHYVFQSITTVAATYTYSVRAKYTNNQWIALRIFDGTSSFFGSFDIQNGVAGAKSASATTSITSLGNGWYQLNVTATCVASASSNVLVALNNADSASIVTWTPAGTETADIWGADLRTGSSAGTYQRIAAATNYATAGFLPYLALDGADDWMASSSINFSATDKMSVCFGVTKLSDALVGMVTELSANYGTNAGSFYFAAPETTGASGDFSINARGSTSGTRVSSIANAPVTRVATGLIDIAAPSKTLRLNGSQVDANSSSMGTGNFGNYPLYIGRRGGASLPFNGHIYQMVVCGKALSAGELSSTEAYVNSKTGAY